MCAAVVMLPVLIRFKTGKGNRDSIVAKLDPLKIEQAKNRKQSIDDRSM